MKIEVGMKLTVRKDIKNMNSNTLFVNEEMEALAGKKAKITTIDVDGTFKLDISNHWWSVSMFDEFNKWIINILEIHNKWLQGAEGGECANLHGADLRGANLRGADLRDADLRDANLYGANLRCADLRDANLYGADLRCADLRYANLYGAYLRGADLRDANLYGADLRCADLRDANLYGAYLRGADLRDADLRGANLHGADLYGADLYDANLECNGINYKIEKIISATNIGSRNDTTLFYITQCKNIIVKCGCFYDFITKFEKAVRETHEGTIYEKQYAGAIVMAKACIE